MPEDLSCPGDAGQQRRDVPLLAAKLAVASLPDPLLARTRLLARLDSAVAGPVTLVCAPAGWGKTTLLASWFRGRPAERTTTWLSVGPSDDGGRLWPYLRAALTPATGGVPATVAGPPDQEDVEHLAAALADREEPVVLVLDDLHRVTDSASLTAVEFLLRHADERLRLVIGARSEPPLALHRLRVSGELTEIRTTDLAFTDDEVVALLTAHGVVVPPAAVGVLRERTEGWPVGLRLAALALRGHPDPARFVDRFGGDQPDIADYLTGEVLAGLPGDLRAVLDCSALTEPVTGDLVNALTGRDDADRLLAGLEQRTGFLTASDERPPTYHCHRLLADLLHAELSRRPVDELRELHHRAAQWYAGVGQPGAALRHWLAAGRWGDAAQVLLDRWPELVPYDRKDAGRTAIGDRPGHPTPAPPAQALRAEPALALAYAADQLSVAAVPVADGYLHLTAGAAEALPEPVRSRFRRAAAALALARAQFGGDPAQVSNAADQLLRLAAPKAPETPEPGREPGRAGTPGRGRAGTPDPGRAGTPGPGRVSVSEHAVRAVARTALGQAALGAGRLSAAAGDLTAGLVEARRAGLHRVTLVAASRLALVAAVRGELRAAERAAADALATPMCQDRPDHRDCAYAYLALALVALHRDRPAQAEANLALAQGAGTDGYGPDHPAFVACAAHCRSQLLRDQGELTLAYQVLTEARAALGDPTTAGPPHWLLGAEADLRAGHGDLDTARELLAPRAADSAALAVALARVELCADDPGAAARALPDWDGPTAGELPLAVRVEAGTLDALLAWRARDTRRAARTLERVLELAEPDGLRRFLVHSRPPVRDLLVAHLDSGTAYWPTLSDLVDSGATTAATTSNGTVGPPGEPLTERELTILRYLQSILSNVEIASELSVSVNTVKTHVRNIYRKLAATRRREAVRRARELHLL